MDLDAAGLLGEARHKAGKQLYKYLCSFSVTVPKSKHLLKKGFNFVSQYSGAVY